MTSATYAVRKVALTTWEGIWYVLQCVAFGAGYFCKIPCKKAMKDFGLTEMTGGEQFWYVLMCIAFGIGYWAKIPVAKALSELPQFRSQQQAQFATLSPVPSPPPIPPRPSTQADALSSPPPTAPGTSTSSSEGSVNPPEVPGPLPDTPSGQ
jgi:hypothetical protein